MNIVRFLCYWGIVKWEAIYNKSVDKAGQKTDREMEEGEED